jgi:MFS family permease
MMIMAELAPTVTSKLTYVSREFGLDKLDKTAKANLSANLVTTMQAGAFAGALLANPLADRLGRKPGLLVVSIFAFIGGILQAFSYGSFACFYVGRLVNPVDHLHCVPKGWDRLLIRRLPLQIR